MVKVQYFLSNVISLGYFPPEISFKIIFLCIFSFNLRVIYFWLVFFASIVSAFIDSETCPRVWLKVFHETYPNRTYRFSSPVLLWKVVARVPVECNWLLTPIDLFYWSKISFKLFTQAYFNLLLTSIYWIYWISVIWSWNFPSNVIANFMCSLYKPNIQILFSRSLVDGRVEGAGFVVTIVIINLFTGFKEILEDKVY